MLSLRANYERLVRSLGVLATVTNTKTGASQAAVPVGIARLGNESQLINEYGVGSRIVTILAADLPFALQKFDTVDIPSERLVLDFVMGVHDIGGALIGYRGVVRGKTL